VKRVAACDWAFNNGLIFVDEIQHFCETELKEISEIMEHRRQQVSAALGSQIVPKGASAETLIKPKE
jgi:hypothetical protein